MMSMLTVELTSAPAPLASIAAGFVFAGLGAALIQVVRAREAAFRRAADLAIDEKNLGQAA